MSIYRAASRPSTGCGSGSRYRRNTKLMRRLPCTWIVRCIGADLWHWKWGQIRNTRAQILQRLNQQHHEWYWSAMQVTPSESVHRNNGLALTAEVRILAQSRPLIASIYAHRDIQSLTSSKPFQAHKSLARQALHMFIPHLSVSLHVNKQSSWVWWGYEAGMWYTGIKRECFAGIQLAHIRSSHIKMLTRETVGITLVSPVLSEM